MAVTIERTNNEFVIKLPLNTDPIEIQKILEHFRFIDVVGRSEATQEDIDELSKDVKSGWSQETKDKLRELDEFKDLFE